MITAFQKCFTGMFWWKGLKVGDVYTLISNKAQNHKYMKFKTLENVHCVKIKTIGITGNIWLTLFNKWKLESQQRYTVPGTIINVCVRFF